MTNYHKQLSRWLATLTLALVCQIVHGAQIEFTVKGVKTVVTFNSSDKRDVRRAIDEWLKGDRQPLTVFSETGVFRVYAEPRDDAPYKEVGAWYYNLDLHNQSLPAMVNVIPYDKTKWFPRDNLPGLGWIKNDERLIRAEQFVSPVKNWNIRYWVTYAGTDTALSEAGIKPSHDEYDRYHYDREGYLLDNRTLKRKVINAKDTKINIRGAWSRMFQYGDLVTSSLVDPKNPDVRLLPKMVGGTTFNLKQFMALPKVGYDPSSEHIFAWATFDDPVTPVYDKTQGNYCVADCKDKRKWAP